jgi:hypothetical protein
VSLRTGGGARESALDLQGANPCLAYATGQELNITASPRGGVESNGK